MNQKTIRHYARLALTLALSALLLPQPALAYIGPGVGAGAIGAVLGVIGSVFLALFAVIWYPVKRLLKARKKKSDDGKTDGE